MLGIWRSLGSDVERETWYVHLHGCDLLIERLEEHRWHWRIGAGPDRLLAEGESHSLCTAQRAAEDELFAVHPPTGTWGSRLLGN